MAYAETGRLRLYYEQQGAGPRLLYLGGTGGDLRRPRHALERALGAAFDCVLFDQRGMGRSDKPDLACSMADYADDAAALLDHLGWQCCAVLGYSFGGMVAQELALRHPARVARLALLSTTAGGAGGSSYPLHELLDLPLAEQARRIVQLGDVRRDGAWQAANAKLFAALVEDTLAGFRLAGADAAGRAGRLRQLEARRGHDTWARLARIALPVSVFAGRHDGIAPPAFQRALAGAIPGARYAEYDGGHLFFLQVPAAVADIAAALRGR